MIDSLNEINRLLLGVDSLSLNQKGKGALESSVITFCQNKVIEGRFPDHKATINFSMALNIVEKYDNRLQLTNLGKELLKLNPKFGYELNDEQKEFLTTRCLLKGKASSMITEVLKQFTPAYPSKTYQWSPVDNKPLTGDPTIIKMMRQSGLLKENNRMLEVDRRYVRAVRDMIKPAGLITPQELIQGLKTASEVGTIAEDIVLNFEKERLQKLNCLVESECIQKISELNVGAGYDIASFDGQNLTLVPDRFIEVKGSTGVNVSFYWSKNEIEQAKRLGTKLLDLFCNKHRYCK